MCDFTNEPNSLTTFMSLRILELEEQVEDLKVALIVALNPGISIEAVRASRAIKDVGLE